MNEFPISKTRLYRIFQGMKDRCYNTNSTHYKTYGARGITICSEWLGEHGLQNFISWSLDNGYEEALTIDRKNNDKGYSPDNCQWVTKSYNSSKGNLDIECIEKFSDNNLQSKPEFSSKNPTPLKLSLKSIIAKQGYTIKKVNDELNRRHGTNYTIQNFSNRLRKESFSYNEVEEILEIIGYQIEWVSIC